MRIGWLTIALAFSCAKISAEKIAKPGLYPIQAELMADLHSRLLKVGGTVYARVTVEWRGSNCVLRNGAVLEARVVSVVPNIKPVKGSEVGLAFTQAQCGDLKLGPFPLLLAAIAAPPQPSDMGITDLTLPVKMMSGVPGMIVANQMGVNHDTDLQTSQKIVTNKLLGYAYILTSEGYPSVFYKDYSTDPGCYGLKAQIDNLIWIHEVLANGPTEQRWKDFDVFAYENNQGVRYVGPAVLPEPNELGWKDVVQCPAAMITRIIVHFEGFPGKYLYHCHILEHEANDMMRPFEVIA